LEGCAGPGVQSWPQRGAGLSGQRKIDGSCLIVTRDLERYRSVCALEGLRECFSARQRLAVGARDYVAGTQPCIKRRRSRKDPLHRDAIRVARIQDQAVLKIRIRSGHALYQRGGLQGQRLLLTIAADDDACWLIETGGREQGPHKGRLVIHGRVVNRNDAVIFLKPNAGDRSFGRNIGNR
jgi:hypothetical protein